MPGISVKRHQHQAKNNEEEAKCENDSNINK